jgi:hypothetical protein
MISLSVLSGSNVFQTSMYFCSGQAMPENSRPGERTGKASKHIRRVNPRGQPVTGQGRPGGSNNSHRLVRRGIPYGPTYVPGQPDDGIERGLLGYFINSNIENQYEFVLKQWVNDAEFVGAVRMNLESKDVIIGANDPSESVFEIPQAGGAPPLKISGFSRFVTTRAMAYWFLPSVTALKFIANLGNTCA